jgi:ribosomal protein S18 acetylase RimI-like enzyme
MMTMQAAFELETRNVHTLEWPDGYATYMFQGDECYIEDIYVKPKIRQTALASEMADAIKFLAKEHGCKFLTGSVNGRHNDPTTSARVLLGYGFKIDRILQDAIIFKMEL